MRSAARIGVVLLALACDARREAQSVAPPPQAMRDVAAIPNPPPPRAGVPFRGEHPLYREPRTPRPDEPVRNPAVMPAVLRSVAPEYSPEARKAHIQGVVILDAVIERDGRVSAARVLKPLPFGLSEQAVAAVKQWRYSAGMDAHVTHPRSSTRSRCMEPRKAGALDRERERRVHDRIAPARVNAVGPLPRTSMHRVGTAGVASVPMASTLDESAPHPAFGHPLPARRGERDFVRFSCQIHGQYPSPLGEGRRWPKAG
jgi:TonB family protein